MLVSRLFHFARQVLRVPGRIVAPAIHLTDRWASEPGAQSWAFRILERLHKDPRPEIEGKQRALTALLTQLSLGHNESSSGQALVFLHRGDAILHSCHQLMIAAGLEAIGYGVKLVVCGGGVERCGVEQIRAPFAIPPITCFSCRNCLTPLAAVSNLVEELPSEPPYPHRGELPHALDSILPSNIDQLLFPALLRHFQGHLPEISQDRQERAAFHSASRRFISRSRKLFTALKPSVVCLFNGQTFPESVIAHVAGEMEIPVLFSERGVQANSMFISRDCPASHYHVDRLWETTRRTIGESEREKIRKYVENRRKTNIDPLGVDRGFSRIDGDSAHLAMTAEPYSIFFAPVLHDTASAGKNNGLGEVSDVLIEICRAAREKGLRLIIRSHPDERRPHNPARYTIRQLLNDRGVKLDDRIVNLDSNTSWNPYFLAEHADHVLVHNGTIAMECGVAGICAINTGRSHYSNKGFTLDPQNSDQLSAMLSRPVPSLGAQDIALAEEYFYYYLHIATIAVSDVVREVANFTCEALGPSAKSKEQLRAVQERVEFLLRK